mgnify:CR=1 FL=1
MDLKNSIRTIPDFPKKGIMFRDITTLLLDPKAFGQTIDSLTNRYIGMDIDLVAGIESRGFILGSALAHRLNKGFVPIRKKGKLPGKVESIEYALEYGTDKIEVHLDAIKPGQRVLVVDDLIATGGTAVATCQLVEKLGGHVTECCFAVDLPDLGGKSKLAPRPVFALMEFPGH